MDTLLLLPFQLWGLAPHISRNINPVFERPRFHAFQTEIPIRGTDDYGILLRTGLDASGNDSTALSRIYSYQISDTFYVFGASIRKPLITRPDTTQPAAKQGELQFYYDYAGTFKQATVFLQWNSWQAGYVETFKLYRDEAGQYAGGNHLQLLFAGFESYHIALQQLDTFRTLSLHVPFLRGYLMNGMWEAYAFFPYRRGWFRGEGGIYGYRGGILPYYSVRLSPSIIRISSRFEPYYMETMDTVVKAHMHTIGLEYGPLYVEAGLGHQPLPVDTGSWEERDFFRSVLRVKFNHLTARILWIPASAIPMEAAFSLSKPTRPWKHVKFVPHMEVRYWRNHFPTINPPHTFHLTAGGRFVFYDAVVLDLAYEGNAGFYNLWNGHYYRLGLWINLED